MASIASGPARTIFDYPENLLLKIPRHLPLEIVALSEFSSICFHAVCESQAQKNEKFAVIGDGSMAFFYCFVAFGFFKDFPKKFIYDWDV